MQAIDTLLFARYILPVQPRGQYYEHHALAIHQGRIVAIVPQDQALTQYQAKQCRHFHHHVLMPGLVNSHTHSPMTLLRGIADHLPLNRWLNECIWPMEQQWITPETVLLGSQLAIAEMLQGGTTCFNDHYFFAESTLNAVQQAGIRAVLGLMVIDAPSPQQLSGPQAIQAGLDMIQRHSLPEHISWAWAPHAPYSVSDDSFVQICQANRSLNLPIHLHLHETAQEIEQSQQQHGCRPIERLAKLSVLDHHLIAVHMTQQSASDRQLMQQHHCHLVHCPHSNCKLACGLPPITDCLHQPINCALGTDGSASNDALDLWAEMKTAALLAKHSCGDPAAFCALDAIEMATWRGAQALGLAQHIGSLEAGKSADIIAVAIPPLRPFHQLAAHLVYSGQCHWVSDVWVAGRCLLRDRQLTTLDPTALIDAIKQQKFANCNGMDHSHKPAQLG